MSQIQSNAESPDVPGGADIAIRGGSVSPLLRQFVPPIRHGRACPGHPRRAEKKTWMPGIKPGMTARNNLRFP
ncbi:MAG: hypothetical protein EKK33_31825 [Bradyrhizobiaceae bacterium]|nr:MAG: hypothetical protein EKK33_31825 [Bradyrhizobiaceae bacterium]